MKTFKLVLIGLLVTACSKETIRGPVGKSGKDGVGCTVTTVVPSLEVPNGGALIMCGTTQSLITNGVNGAVGADGKSAYDIWLDEGNSGSMSDYLAGLTGANGLSAYELWLGEGNSGSLESFLASLQGPIGMTGPAGSQSAYSITELVDPCGSSGNFDEVLIRFSNGVLLASFSVNGNANLTRLSVLVPGNSYVTTDSQSCHFTVALDGSVSW